METAAQIEWFRVARLVATLAPVLPLIAYIVA
jgi:hypothetical protein